MFSKEMSFSGQWQIAEHHCIRTLDGPETSQKPKIFMPFHAMLGENAMCLVGDRLRAWGAA